MTTRLLLILSLAAAILPGADNQTILAVFAHPDDEITVGAVLARYADEGHDVYLATITSGQQGVGNTDIPAGDELGKAREAEARCSAQKLGIHEPFLLGFQDGNIASRRVIGPITERVLEVINEVKPDIIITFDGGGITGHPDHRIAGAVTTEAFLRQKRLTHLPAKLYYVAIPESALPDPLPRGFDSQTSPIHDSFITTAIDSAKYGDQVFEAMQCHQTQWAPIERMKGMFDAWNGMLGGKTYLRLALTPGGASAEQEDDILAGLPE
jgi:LmbE family N-acetylglucosaminyl deacetylase